MKTKLIDERVFSPVNDTNIRTNLNESPIWKNAFKLEELTNEVKTKHPMMFEYTIKFDGLTPVQVTNVKIFNGK